MNKKGQARNDQGLAILIVAFVVIGVLILYFLSKMLFTVGIALILISIFLIIMGFASEEDNLIWIGLIVLLIAIILTTIGYTGISFFENNPTGKNLLDGANTVVNTSKDVGKTYVDTMNQVNQIPTSP